MISGRVGGRRGWWGRGRRKKNENSKNNYCYNNNNSRPLGRPISNIITAKPVLTAGSLRCNDGVHRRKLRHCAFQEPSNITAAQNEAWTFSTPRGSPTPNFSIGCRKILDSTPNRSIVLQMQRRIATSICTYNADPRIQRRSAKRIAIQRRTTFWHWMLPNQH